MSFAKISEAVTTDMKNQQKDYSVPAADTETFEEVTIDWPKWNGYYEAIPEIQAVVDKKAMWVVGKGFKAGGKVKDNLDKIKGNGKDTFDSIMFNAVRTYTICGNFYAEIIKNKRGELRNLKPLNPGTISILGNKRGIIKGYVQNPLNNLDEIRFRPEEIFHLSWNRISDRLDGIGTIQKLEDIILMRNEAMADMKTVFHRYVKPLIITSVDTDNTDEVEEFKRKLDLAIKNGENLVVPKSTVDKMERMSIPQFSTLDPIPWINLLQKQFIIAEGVPEVILGHSEGATEASAKIMYLAFQQMIEWNQLFLEQQIKSQLNMEIEFNFPASIEPELQADEKKDPKMNKFKKTERQ